MTGEATADLFGGPPARETLAAGAVLLRGCALSSAPALLAGIARIAAVAPFRRMVTPGGFTMSVEMTNCGRAGWVTDRRGYRYTAADPETGRPWPAMPEAFEALAVATAAEAGYPDFLPDACLVNRYAPGTRLTLHQDRNERDFGQPIVSVSLGLPATFLFGGRERSDPVRRVPLSHGDVVVWGGPARLHHHGILPLKDGVHPATGRMRLNLTFRRAG